MDYYLSAFLDLQIAEKRDKYYYNKYKTAEKEIWYTGSYLITGK